MKYKIKITTKFKKDYRAVINSGYNPVLLEEVLKLLSEGMCLPEKNKDHFLSGNWAGYRECHITPDWLLIY